MKTIRITFFFSHIDSRGIHRHDMRIKIKWRAEFFYFIFLKPIHAQVNFLMLKEISQNCKILYIFYILFFAKFSCTNNLVQNCHPLSTEKLIFRLHTFLYKFSTYYCVLNFLSALARVYSLVYSKFKIKVLTITDPYLLCSCWKPKPKPIVCA